MTNLMTVEQFKHRLMIQLMDGSEEILLEGSEVVVQAAKEQLCQRDRRFLNGYNLDHIVKYWIDTPSRQFREYLRLLESLGMVVIID